MMKIMLLWFGLLGPAVLFGTPDPATAASSNAISLPSSMTVFGDQLQLTSCGVREVWMTDIYVVSLYLPQRSGEVGVIMDPKTEKAVRLDIVYDGKIPDEMPDVWRTHLEAKLTPSLMKDMEQLYHRLRPGDVWVVAYSSQRGTTISVDGAAALSDSSSRLIDTLLDLWIGPQPESQNLRRLLLQGVC